MKVIFLCKSFPESLLLLNVLRQNIELQYPDADFTFDLLILDKTDPPLDTIFFQNSRWNATYYASKVAFQKTTKKIFLETQYDLLVEQERTILGFYLKQKIKAVSVVKIPKFRFSKTQKIHQQQSYFEEQLHTLLAPLKDKPPYVLKPKYFTHLDQVMDNQALTQWMFNSSHASHLRETSYVLIKIDKLPFFKTYTPEQMAQIINAIYDTTRFKMVLVLEETAAVEKKLLFSALSPEAEANCIKNFISMTDHNVLLTLLFNAKMVFTNAKRLQPLFALVGTRYFFLDNKWVLQFPGIKNLFPLNKEFQKTLDEVSYYAKHRIV